MTVHSQRLWVKIWRQWVPIAVAVTLVCGIVYIIAQQQIRLGTNQPQVQMAEDAAAALTGGEDPVTLTGTHPIDIARSLAAYLVIYDEKGQPLAWSGELDQAAPTVPQGVLTSARDHGENRVTWQPRPGVRSAIVVVPYQGARVGFVLAGRSLRESEDLSSMLLLLVGFGWLGTLIAVFIATWVSRAVAAKLLR